MKKVVLVAFVLSFFLNSTLILPCGATSIVTDYEQVVYSANRILCRFEVKTIVETEKDGTWRASQAENENKYDIIFLITVTYVCPEFVKEDYLYPHVKIHFYSPWSGSGVLDEQVIRNSSWFETDGQTTPIRLFASAGSMYVARIRLEPYFRYSIYHYISSEEEVHLLSSYWRGEPIHIDVTEINKDTQTQIDSLRTELNCIRNLMYVFILTTIVFIATTVCLAVRKPKFKPVTT